MPNEIESDAIVRHRMQVIDNIFKLFIQKDKEKPIREEIEKVMSQKDLLIFPNDTSFDAEMRDLASRKMTNICCSIFSSSLFNESFVNNKIYPIIEKIFLVDNFEDLVFYANDIENKLTLDYFFTNETL